ncbi:glycoside hydrolase family 3 N-terminal domain-containing protein [Nocardia rhamnosiphila]|uniref:Glycoside hydrolase family 3 N-terminal domain-containing protein n=1 Tax=Nocardia rhamnosiphila TaxID=426716 RepID=A0ABV2WRG5_9NOCA
MTQSFGEDADLTGRLTRAYFEGLQGRQLGSASVSAMAKHFPGVGPQKEGTDPHFADGKEQVYPMDGSTTTCSCSSRPSTLAYGR